MGMPAPSKHWTAEDVWSLPDDGNRYEVIDGELFVTPAPTWAHQRAMGSLFTLLDVYSRRLGTMEVLFAPADVPFSSNSMVQPDLFVVPVVEGRRARDFEEAERLLLAVEVLSPTSARADRQAKRRLYQREGVAEYWIIDVDARVVERWRPTDERPEVLVERLEWQPDPGLPALGIELGNYFADACRGQA